MGSDNAVLQSEFGTGSVPEILREIYKEEEILTVGARFEGAGKIAVEFIFPEYPRTRRQLGHVSGVTINAAIVEGVVCAIDDAFRSGRFPLEATPEWYRKSIADDRWIMLSLNVLYRQMVLPDAVATLEFEVLSVDIQRFRTPRLTIRVSFKGFCAGETVWVLDAPPKLFQ